MGLVERMHWGLKPNLKILLSDVLNEIEPVKVIAKEKAKPTGMSLYENESSSQKRSARHVCGSITTSLLVKRNVPSANTSA